MSPSLTVNSLPSARIFPWAFASARERWAAMSAKVTTSARMKPRAMSEWMVPAASMTCAPWGRLQALTSGPATVKKVMSPKAWWQAWMTLAPAGSEIPRASR